MKTSNPSFLKNIISKWDDICRFCLKHDEKDNFKQIESITFDNAKNFLPASISSLLFNDKTLVNFPPWICPKCFQALSDISSFTTTCEESKSILNACAEQICQEKCSEKIETLVDESEPKSDCSTVFIISDGDTFEIREQISEDKLIISSGGCEEELKKHVCVIENEVEEESQTSEDDSLENSENETKGIFISQEIKEGNHEIQIILYQCSQCDEKFSNVSELQIHEKSIHFTQKEEKKDTTNENATDLILASCRDCGLRFASAAEMDTHLSATGHVAGTELLICPVCEGRFYVREHFERHCDTHRTTAQFACDICNLRFHKEEMYKKHIEVKHSKNPNACLTCHGQFDTVEALKEHISETQHGVHKCTFCLRVFAKRSALERHLNTHAGVQSHSCDTCGRRFSEVSNLRRHKLTHASDEEKPFKCEQCGKTFAQKVVLNSHIATHTEEKPFICQVAECGKSFRIKSAYLSHVRAHGTNEDNPVQYPCDKCSRVLHSLVGLKQHESMHEREIASGKKSRSNLRNDQSSGKQEESHRSYLCSICGKVLKSHVWLLQHQATHSDERPNKCDICGKRFKLPTTLRVHIKMVHEGIKRGPYLCNFCGKVFNAELNYKAHIRNHTEVNPFTCKVCNKVFSNSSSLRVHSRTHTGNLPYSCKICGKAFNQPQTLRNHIRTHTNEKPFPCPHCPKKFSLESTRAVHIRIHTGELPYECQVCGRRFNQSNVLKTHLRTHTKERPFPCPHCPKSFSQPSNLDYHLRTHTGEKPYTCPYCSKSFALNGNLTVHIRQHTGERPYRCHLCDRGFYDASSRKRHITKLHGAHEQQSDQDKMESVEGAITAVFLPDYCSEEDTVWHAEEIPVDQDQEIKTEGAES